MKHITAFILFYNSSGASVVVSIERIADRSGSTADALLYEVEDMERAIEGQNAMHLDYTRDVMRIMTDIRRQWGMTYPEEE